MDKRRKDPTLAAQILKLLYEAAQLRIGCASLLASGFKLELGGKYRRQLELREVVRRGRLYVRCASERVRSTPAGPSGTQRQYDAADPESRLEIDWVGVAESNRPLALAKTRRDPLTRLHSGVNESRSSVSVIGCRHQNCAESRASAVVLSTVDASQPLRTCLKFGV